MTFCQSRFDAFNLAIRLDATRIGRVSDACKAFESFVNEDDELRVLAYSQPFLQGSVATRTVIKPLAGDEFDVDIVYPFDISRLNTHAPVSVMQWFTSRIRRSGFYSARMEVKNRCIRINYAGDFHIDIIPSTPTLPGFQPFAVPTRDAQGWIVSDPLGFVKWVLDIDARTASRDMEGNGRFVRGCRMLKRWRDVTFSVAASPSSILLLTMLGRHEPSHNNYSPPLEDKLYPQYECDATYLFDMARVTLGCITSPDRHAFFHPTLDEDLSRDWAGEHLAGFIAQLTNLVSNLRKAIYSQDEYTASQYFKASFGGSFPTS